MTTVIDCGRLVDGTQGDPIDDARVVVEGGRVTAVGTREGIDPPGDADHHNFPAGTVIPGLIDAHLHLKGVRTMDPMDWTIESSELGTARATADLRELLAAGFTTVRDLGSSGGIALRDAVEEGEIPGPRIYTSQRSISQTGGHGDAHFLPYEWAREEGFGLSTLVDGVPECRKEARKRIREGVDCLKIMTTGGVISEKDAPHQSQFTEGEVAAMVEEAHRVDIPVASHAQGAPGIKTALRNGVDTIEHGFYLDDECLDLFDETGATLVPTLSIMHRLVTRGEDHGVPEYGLRKAREASEVHYASARRAHDAGVPVALGTDFIGPDLIPHGENALEAELLVEECGMDELDAIRAGTGIAARTLPDDDVGTLETGNRADLVVLDGDPTLQIGALREVRTVYRGGEPVFERGEGVVEPAG